MIPVAEAQARVLALIAPLGEERVALRRAAGRVLRAHAAARRDQPPFDAAQMDGYAVIAAQSPPGGALDVIGEAGAGAGFTGRVRPGQAVRIFTGAPVPAGADAVLIQEDARREGARVIPEAGVAAGANIRPQGSDFAAGTGVSAPRRLRPGEIALLAAMNVPEVTVARRPVVAFLSTGDELVEPGESPGPDQIVASAALALAAMAEAEGAEARILPIARDSEAAVARILALTEGADLIVTIGGASVGDRDVLAQAAPRLGIALDLHKVALRPGKPLMAGRHGAVPLIGVPGNPVSALVCAELFILPAIRALQGLPDPLPRALRGRAAVAIEPNGPRAHYMRARLEPGADLPALTPMASQDSARLLTFCDSGALVIRAPHAPAAEPGEIVDFLPL